jgi:pimeloyl-ACP methyl ester carboxylesterase
MKKIILILVILTAFDFTCIGQAELTNQKSRKFKTSSKLRIEGEMGYLLVPENRNNPLSRKIKVKYIHLKSLATSPVSPVIFLEGGGGASTWQAKSKDYLEDWIEILEVADLIFIDRRGSNDKALTYLWKKEYPKDFMVSEDSANQHSQNMAKAALPTFKEKGIDIRGYNIEEYAKDVNDLMIALEIDSYSIFGFSFGTGIGITLIKLFPERIDRAILAGADAPNQFFNYPYYLDAQIAKIGEMLAQDSSLKVTIPDFEALVSRVMTKLRNNPVTVSVKNPLDKQIIDLKIGPFGLALILRLDIDDTNDIPAIPRLLYSIDQGDYSMLTWFAQKRMVFGLALPGNGINQQLASGTQQGRWSEIQEEASASIFGNVVNFPFSAVKYNWVESALSFDPADAIETDIPTLFITGTLDCRTPVQQVEETMKGFRNAIHIKVANAGHEQAMWERETFNESIPTFLLGKEIKNKDASYSKIKFLSLEGKTQEHPSLK